MSLKNWQNFGCVIVTAKFKRLNYEIKILVVYDMRLTLSSKNWMAKILGLKTLLAGGEGGWMAILGRSGSVEPPITTRTMIIWKIVSKRLYILFNLVPSVGLFMTTFNVYFSVNTLQELLWILEDSSNEYTWSLEHCSSRCAVDSCLNISFFEMFK